MNVTYRSSNKGLAVVVQHVTSIAVNMQAENYSAYPAGLYAELRDYDGNLLSKVLAANLLSIVD